MKYLKTFEREYWKGDYILLNMEKLRKEQMFDKFEIKDDMAKIVDIDLIANAGTEYSIEFFDGPNSKFTFVRKDEIKRFLTPEEIEKFKMKEQGIKYNL